MNNTELRHLLFGVLFLCLFKTFDADAQVTSAKNKSPFPVKYTSAVDQKIILKTITLAPVYDNVNGVYSAPIQKLLIDLLQNDKVWGYSEFPNINQKIFVETYDSHPNEVLDVLGKTSSQGLLTALITKGPRGLNARLKLYTQDQGLILLEESFQDLDTFEINKLREEFVTLYHNLKNKLPYRGFVLSRRAVEVTLNLGSQNGVTLGQELTLAQILKLNRHPKLKTLVGIEKEIIGRLKVTKVEPYLSFAQIIFEKETGVVDVGAKVLPTEYVSYPMPTINDQGEVVGDQKVNSVPTSETKSETKKEEKKQDTPKEKNSSLGKVIGQVGVTQYAESTSFNGGGSADANQSIAPTIYVGGQVWAFPNIFVEANIKQIFFTANNSLAGSTPTSLNYNVSRYQGALGYNYMIDNSQWGPQIAAAIGFTSYKTQVSDTTPTALTSTQTDGISLNLSGVMPLQPEYPVEIGANLQFLMSPKYSETPVTSGESSLRVSSFGFFATYISTPTLHYRFDLSFENIEASFSGTGTRTTPANSTSIKMASQTFGIEYLF